ncbi:MAG: 1-(5-phosphoribosyl)-5-[(5-phosphoribosylamino)methylideneamino]imidazole-4-carboxamide isomerase [Chitinophagaceae bacterium]|nr:1-(5-phosphoribosyl)-5-[(5-phosphoribosylamino)methylideneamino]imidazole-4-carboxamide isomerase [Chitinophagaceae bacterium]
MKTHEMKLSKAELREIIIPAMDIMEGQCVRLEQGDYGRKKMYDEDPIDAALRFEDAGFSRLHLVDLDGARERKVLNWKTLEKIAGKTSLKIDFSGGIHHLDDVKIALNSGASFLCIGTIAAEEPETMKQWISIYSPELFILSADVKNEHIAVRGWEKDTGLPVDEFIGAYHKQGINKFLCTDIFRDGMLQGPSFELYEKLLEKHKEIELIASGGVRSVNDVERLIYTGCKGVIIGKALYEQKIHIEDLTKLFL